MISQFDQDFDKILRSKYSTINPIFAKLIQRNRAYYSTMYHLYDNDDKYSISQPDILSNIQVGYDDIENMIEDLKTNLMTRIKDSDENFQINNLNNYETN